MPAIVTPTTLDETALARLRELDPDGRHGVVQRVLTAFEASLTRALGQLQEQQAAADAKTVATLAHTLKSSSASVGALGLAAACAQVESRLRDGQTMNLRDDVGLLLAHGRAAQAAVGAMLRL
ncbi:MAG TPA: Hpt domain-containing protein [Rubrivivax sp.]|nr:Hpt domain-containing protein [Rubrivivax sp.]